MSDVTVDCRGHLLHLKFAYDEDTIDIVKNIPGRRYSKTEKAWTVPKGCLPFVMAQFPNAMYVGPAGSLARLHGQFSNGRDVRASVENYMHDDRDSNPDRPLYQFQKEGVFQLDRLDRVLLGDQMGLGKTVQSIVAAEMRNPKRVLILCPSSLKLNWAKEIQLAYPGEFVGIGYDAMAKWVIESYDTAWRPKAFKTLTSRTFDIAILDETHFIKNVDAKRTKGVFEILEKIPVRFGLTGTPMQNRPADLVGVLIALGYLTRGSRWGFLNRYCGPVDNGYAMEYLGATHLDELHKALKFFMVRRLKKDVLKDLPPKIYTDDVFSISKQSAYWEIEKTYRVHIKKVKSGALPESKLGRQSKLMELMRESALAKVDVAEDRVRAALDSGLKLLFFSTFKDPIKQLAARFGSQAISFTGDTPPHQRAGMIEKFESDPFVRVAFCTVGTGGTGHNMTAAKIVMFLDQPWSPARKEQAIDRAHRIGQNHGLQVVNLIAHNTVDERMVWVNVNKHQVVSQVIDGEVSEFEGAEGLLEELENYYAA